MTQLLRDIEQTTHASGDEALKACEEEGAGADSVTERQHVVAARDLVRSKTGFEAAVTNARDERGAGRRCACLGSWKPCIEAAG